MLGMSIIAYSVLCLGQSVVELEGDLVSRLYGQFPGDVGCFIPYLLNVLHLSPGEALYLAPNEPHAYLYGGMICVVYDNKHL